MAEERVICQSCAAAGQRSRVNFTVRTSGPSPVVRFYEEDGSLHEHDANIRTTAYECTRGHRWYDKVRLCGYAGCKEPGP